MTTSCYDNRKEYIDFRMIDYDQMIFDKQIDFDSFFDKNVITITIVVAKNKHNFDKYKK